MTIKLLPVLLIATLSAIAWGETSIEWHEQTHNFGAFEESSGPVTAHFVVQNVGTEPVSITAARATCGCTRPNYTHRPIAPGDTAVVAVRYEPAGRPGRFEKKVYVDFSGDVPRSTLFIRGTVIGDSTTLASRYPESFGPLRLKSKMLPFGEVNNNGVKSAYIEIYNTSTDSVSPLIEGTPRQLHVSLSPGTIPPGEQGIISATLYAKDLDDYGLISEEFNLIADADKTHTTPLPIEWSANIKEWFGDLTEKDLERAPVCRVEENVVDFGHLDSESTSPLTRTFSITNFGNAAPLSIRRIYAPDKFISLGAVPAKIKKGKSARVSVTVNPAMLHDEKLLNTRVIIITNDPKAPVQQVRLIGEVLSKPSNQQK